MNKYIVVGLLFISLFSSVCIASSLDNKKKILKILSQNNTKSIVNNFNSSIYSVVSFRASPYTQV